MKMAAPSNSIGLRLDGSFQLWNSRYLLAATVAMAIVLGVSAAEQKWYVFVAVAVVPLVLLWPIEVALGGYALLFPFDAILVLGSNSRGTTLDLVCGNCRSGRVGAEGDLWSKRAPAPSRSLVGGVCGVGQHICAVGIGFTNSSVATTECLVATAVLCCRGLLAY